MPTRAPLADTAREQATSPAARGEEGAPTGAGPVTAAEVARLRSLVHALSNDLGLLIGAVDLVVAEAPESLSPLLQAWLREAQRGSTRAQSALGEISAILRGPA